MVGRRGRNGRSRSAKVRFGRFSRGYRTARVAGAPSRAHRLRRFTLSAPVVLRRKPAADFSRKTGRARLPRITRFGILAGLPRRYRRVRAGDPAQVQPSAKGVSQFPAGGGVRSVLGAASSLAGRFRALHGAQKREWRRGLDGMEYATAGRRRDPRAEVLADGVPPPMVGTKKLLSSLRHPHIGPYSHLRRSR